jgi:hypothetical protein
VHVTSRFTTKLNHSPRVITIYTRNARYTYNDMYAVHNACVFGRKFYSKIMLFDTSYSAAVVVLCEFSVLKLNYKIFRSHSRLSHYILFRWQINFLAPLFLRRSLSLSLSHTHTHTLRLLRWHKRVGALLVNSI